MQGLIRELPGVVSTRVGYIGENPATNGRARPQWAMRSSPPPTPDRGAANVLQALAQRGDGGSYSAQVPPPPVLGSDSTRLCHTRWRSSCPGTGSLGRTLRC